MLKIFIWLRNLAALIGGLWLVVTLTPLVTWWGKQLAQPWGDCKGDTLIVLGGDSLGDGVLGSSSYWRAVYTVRAMRNHNFAKVIISAGPSDGNIPVAESIRDFIRGHGIDTSPVVVESESRTTIENAVLTGRLLEGGASNGKVVLLTSDYHVWRAFRVFRKAGVPVADACPVPDVLKRANFWASKGAIFVELVSESAKIGWYRWKGWI